MKKFFFIFSISLTIVYWLIGLVSYILPSNILYKILFLGSPIFYSGINNELQIRYLSNQSYKGEEYYLFFGSLGLNFIPQYFAFGIATPMVIILFSLFICITLVILWRRTLKKNYLYLLLAIMLLFILNIPHLNSVFKEWEFEKNYLEVTDYGP